VHTAPGDFLCRGCGVGVSVCTFSALLECAYSPKEFPLSWVWCGGVRTFSALRVRAACVHTAPGDFLCRVCGVCVSVCVCVCVYIISPA